MKSESLKNSSKDRTRKKKPKPSKRRRDSSPSSSSSCSDVKPRGHLKKAKKSRRRREVRKQDLKWARRARRWRDSSTSSVGRSCSTFGDADSSSSDLSRSPARTKRRVRGRSRERSRRKRSCSTCSGYITCGQSSSSASEGKSRKRYRPSSQKAVQDERNRGKRSREDGEARIIKAYDDFPSSKSNNRYCGERKEVVTTVPVSQKLESEKRRLEVIEDMVEDNSKNSSRTTWSGADGGGSGDIVGGPLTHQSGLTEEDAMRNKSEVVANTGAAEVDDLEMILRQKALENFRKHQGQVSMKGVSDVFDNEESLPIDSCNNARKAVEVKPLSQVVYSSVLSSKNKPTCTLEDYRSEAYERDVDKPVPRLSSLVIPYENIDRNPPACSVEDKEGSKTLVGGVTSSFEVQNTSRQIPNVHRSSNKKTLEQLSLVKVAQDNRASRELRSSKPGRTEVSKAYGSLGASSSKKMTSEQAPLMKDPQDNRASIELGSSKAGGTEVTKADVSASEVLSLQNSQSSPCSPPEPATGSQFEQKTFSRMHDGEVVQVSYKVYIPKRTPTLARRRLQR